MRLFDRIRYAIYAFFHPYEMDGFERWQADVEADWLEAKNRAEAEPWE